MVFVFLVVFLEAAVTADVFLNRNWEEVSYLSRCTIFFTLLELLHYKLFFLIFKIGLVLCLRIFQRTQLADLRSSRNL